MSSLNSPETGDLQAMANAAGTINVTCGLNGTVRAINVTAERLLGWTAGDVVGKESPLLWHDADEVSQRGRDLGQPAMPGIASLLAGIDASHSDLRRWTFVRRDGTRFPVLQSVAAQLDSTAQISGYVFTAFDLTERIEHEQECDRLFQLSLDIFCIANQDGYFKLINPAFSRTLGWSDAEILSRPFIEFVHPDDRDATIREVERQVIAGEPVLRFENRYQHRDGSWRVLSWRSVPQPGGLMYATARDVTERRQLEADLRKSEEDLSVTLRSIGDAVLATDAQRRITRMNPVAESLTGWREIEAIGRPIDEVFQIVNEQTGSPATVPVDEVLATGNVQGLANHTALIARDGSRRSIADSAAPIRDRQGGILGVVLVFRDVTHEREHDRHRQQLNQDLERRVEERTTELAARERFIRDTLDALTSHLAVLDATGTIIAVNRAWSAFAEENEAPPGAVGLGVNYLEICDAAAARGDVDAAHTAQGLRAVLSGSSGVWEFEYPCHSSQVHRWFYCRITPFADTVDRYVVVAHDDITPLREAEQELERARGRFHHLFQCVPDGIVLVDRDGVIVDANPQVEAILGWTRNELLQQPIEVLVPEEIRERHVADRNRFIASPENRRMAVDRSRLYGVHKDGSRVALDVRLSPMTIAEGTLVAAIIRDVTEQVRASDVLQSSERRYRTLFESTQDAVMTAAPPDWKFTSGNPATLRMFRVRDETEFKSLGPSAFSPEHQPDGRPSMQQIEGHINQAMTVGSDYFEWTHRRLDGEEFPATVLLTRMELDGVLQLQATIRDITEEKRVLNELLDTAEELRAANATIAKERSELAQRVEQRTAELTDANARLTEVSRHKSEFLASMSHELRTPLNGILGMNELLLATELTSRQREYVEASRVSGKHLAQLINDVLDLSRIEAGKIEFDEHPCRLDEVVFDVAAMFAPVAEQRAVSLTCRVAPAACVTIHCDDQRLRQVLTNLVGNALKFTSAGSVTIDVDVDRREGAPVGDWARVSITDTGIGIPEDRLHRLFQAFTQIDSSTTRRFGGTGLGLSICKQLVELMQGRIGVDSKEGVGSTFWFEIPLHVIDRPFPVRHEARLLRGTRIMAVADWDRERPQIAEHLTAWGCEIIPVNHLDELPSALAGVSSAPVLILSDHESLVCESAEDDTPLAPLSSAGWICLGKPIDEAIESHLRKRGVREVLRDPIRPSDLFNALFAAAREQSSGDVLTTTMAPMDTPAQPLQGHVLVAEDNRINQMYIMELLRQLGCTCDLAENGQEAVDALERQRYDLILMDCQMPELDGFAATREIREREAFGQLHGRRPIIALTANALAGDRERCLAAGMDDYVCKPVEGEQLRQILRRYLGSAERAGEAQSGE